MPLIPEVGVLALPYHHWGTRWMTPHHVLTRLAHYFHVEWLEPAHHWRDSFKSRQIPPIAPHIPSSFKVYVPEALLPEVYRPEWLRNGLLKARVRRGWQRLKARGCRARVLHLWHPYYEAALDAGGYDLSLYHIDDEYSFSPNPPPVSEEERRVLQRVDQAFAISPALIERKSGVNPNLAFVPEGVDFRLYSTPVPPPADIAKIPHPRVGYTGNLKRQLDWRLLSELSLRHPEWSFVFVGPRTLPAADEAIATEMSKRPNVYFLGPKTVTDLAAYPQHFDVCIMPYLVDGYTNNIYPLKLHEYLASGKPVVGTPIRSLQDFTHVISLASGTDEWSAALARALESSGNDAASIARQAVARQHDWSELIHRIASLVCKALGPEFDSRLERLDVCAEPQLARAGAPG